MICFSETCFQVPNATGVSVPKKIFFKVLSSESVRIKSRGEKRPRQRSARSAASISRRVDKLEGFRLRSRRHGGKPLHLGYILLVALAALFVACAVLCAHKRIWSARFFGPATEVKRTPLDIKAQMVANTLARLQTILGRDRIFAEGLKFAAVPAAALVTEPDRPVFGRFGRIWLRRSKSSHA